MTMLGLKKFLFKGGAANLSVEMQAAVEDWRKRPSPDLDDLHFHMRYVVIDITTSGMKPDSDRLLSIAATTVQQGIIMPDDASFIDLTETGEALAAVDQQLLGFLQFSSKAPLVTYHVPYVGGFLQHAFRERLGIDFQPQWVDLAWLLPSMFEEKSSSIMPLDQWIEAFGFDTGVGRRSAMDNTLLLTRLFQMLLVRSAGKSIDTAAQLVEESLASSHLRRSH